MNGWYLTQEVPLWKLNIELQQRYILYSDSNTALFSILGILGELHTRDCRHKFHIEWLCPHNDAVLLRMPES